MWEPLPGPQTLALASKADILLYGGAAGGGKTDLLLGAALTAHLRSRIFRRVGTSLEQIVARSHEIYGHLGSYSERNGWLVNYEKHSRQIMFSACQNVGDEKKYDGVPDDFRGFDEIPRFTEMQFRRLQGWVRTPVLGQRTRVIATGNPPDPTNPEESWVIQYWGPWLDPHCECPAKPGELRWVTTDKNGVEHWHATPQEYEYKGKMLRAKSRTFIPAQLEDNPYYMATDYAATLAELPEPLRSQLLYGSYEAGREDNPMQVIPTAWVMAAQKRWAETPKPDCPITVIGCDVARGGRDKTVLTPRYRNWYDHAQVHPGKDTPDGQHVAGLCIAMRGSSGARVNIDVLSVGSSPYDYLRDTIGSSAVAINFAEGSEGTDKSGLLHFANLRAECYWRLREDLDPASGMDICLPPDRELLIDLTAPKWKVTARGLQVEPKEDIIARIGRSPDKGDSLVYAHANKFQPGQGVFEYYRQLNQQSQEKKS